MFWGVCAGLGDYFGIDPVIVRIVFVLLAFAGGVGIGLYVLAAILMPRDDGEPPAVHGVVRRIEDRRSQRWLGIVLIVVAVALIADNVHGFHTGIIWGLLLILLGVLLFEGEWAPWSTAPAGASTTPPPPVPPATAMSETAGAAASVAYGAPTAPSAPPAPPSWSTPSWGGARTSAGAAYQTWQRRRSGPPVGMITVALTLVAVGVAVMLGNAGAISLTVGSTLAIALTAIGAGLVVAAFLRRGRGLLILLGLLLVPVVFAGSVVDEPLTGGTGQRDYAPARAQDVQREYTLAAGQLTLDLGSAHLGAAPTTVHVRVAMGQLIVHVPPDLPLTVHGHVGAGRMELLGNDQDGIQVDSTVTSAGAISDENRLTLDLDVGLGQIHVDRDTAGATP